MEEKKEKPVLIVMAAGMGSRYGGLKQIDPVGNHGQLLLDYSIYDAKRAGFETVIFVIKHEIEQAFHEAIGSRFAGAMQVQYAFQELDDLPAGYTVPVGRAKPWGTAQAVLAARNLVHGPFAVVNSDDYYGPAGFREIYEYLCSQNDYAMVGYRLDNTVTDTGYVARGICEENIAHELVKVTERTHIEKAGTGARFTEDGGKSWEYLPGDTIVSMNLWGLPHRFMDEAWKRFSDFLDAAGSTTAEYFLPSAVSDLITEGKARVSVLRSPDKWYGVTYHEDKATVVDAIAKMTNEGLYPDDLWKKERKA